MFEMAMPSTTGQPHPLTFAMATSTAIDDIDPVWNPEAPSTQILFSAVGEIDRSTLYHE